MKITLKETPEQIQLIQAMASRDPLVRMQAQTSFAEYMGKPLAEAIMQAPTIGNFYTAMSYAKDSNPTIPLDLFSDVNDVGYFSVWSQHADGGLGTNEVKPPSQEMFVDTYKLETAVSFLRKHAAQSRLGVIAKAMSRLGQEILYLQDNFATGPLMNSLANAQTNGLKHVFRVGAADRFLPQDLANIRLRMKRINTSWIKGTPVGAQGKITDLLMSPEAAEELRGMAYNAINTKTAPITDAIKDSVSAPESIREKLFESAGMNEFMGVTFHEYNEFGESQRFNTVFKAAAGSTLYTTFAGGGSAAFTDASDQLMVGIDRSKECLLRLIASDSETGSTLDLQADNQFNNIGRGQDKIGYYGGMEEGRLVLDVRGLVGLIL
jgi:hypothetical protein